MLLRYVVLFSVLLWQSTVGNECGFPDFKFSMKSVKNTTGEWVVKVNLDDKKGRPWDVYINKTSDKSKCHQAILLVLKKDGENATEETTIPNGFSSVPYLPFPTLPPINSAKNPPAERKRHANQARVPSVPSYTPNTIPAKNPEPEFPYTPPEQTVQDPQQSTYQPQRPQSGYPQYEPQYTPKPVPTPKPPPKQPPSSYKYVRNHNYYKIHYNRWTWQEARDKCQSEGSDLAVINSDSEARALGDFISREGARKYDLWVGFHGKEDRDWLTIHDQTLKEAGFDRWWPGQPDYTPGYQQCGIFKYDSANRYGLIDLLCTHDSIFICEFES